MGKFFNKLTAMALALVILAGGQSVARHAVAKEPTWQPKTLPGITTAKSIGSALKSGVSKVGDFLIPSPSIKGTPDPVSLAAGTKPSPELYLSMATMAEAAGNVAGARKHYQQALKLAPNNFEVILQYARFQDRQRDFIKATELYQQAIRSNPDEPSVFNDLGLCFARRNMLPQSLSALERAIQLQPDRRLYRNNIATVLVEQGNVDAAFAHLKAVHEEAVAYYNLGYLMLQKGESRAAARLFSEALTKNPSLVEAKIWLRNLESKGASPQNARRPTPQLRSASRQRPAEVSMRPLRGERASPTRQLQSPRSQPRLMPPSQAVGAPRNPAHVAPLPPLSAVPEGSRSSVSGTRPSLPVRSSMPRSSGDRPVPVVQPLPPVAR